MASSYSTIGRIELMATGEKTNLWGPIANTGLQLLEDMIAGATTVTDLGGTVTLTANNGATDQSRRAMIICTAALTSNLILVIPNQTKSYLFYNRTTNAFTVTVKTSGGSAITMPQGKVAIITCDGANVCSFFGLPADPTTGLMVDNVLTLAKLPQASDQGKIVARKTAAAGNYEEATLSELADLIGSARGTILYRGNAGWAALAPGTSGYVPTSQGAGADLVYAAPSTPAANRNVIINGGMRLAQRYGAVIQTGDDIYTLDRWVQLSSNPTNTGSYQNTSSLPTGASASLAMGLGALGLTAKFGVCQVVEAKNCAHLIGGNVTLSFQMLVSDDTALTTMKAAILSWDGTVDAVTSDLVSSWNASGTTPTFVANWTLENTPVDLSATESWATYTITATVDTASTKNIAIFIWNDALTSSIGDGFGIANVQLESGLLATAFEQVGIQDDYSRCLRYYLGETPIAGGGDATAGSQTGRASSGVQFPTPMRIAPTITFGSTSYGNSATIAASSTNERGTIVGVTSSASGPVYWSSTLSADAEL